MFNEQELLNSIIKLELENEPSKIDKINNNNPADIIDVIATENSIVEKLLDCPEIKPETNTQPTIDIFKDVEKEMFDSNCRDIISDIITQNDNDYVNFYD